MLIGFELMNLSINQEVEHTCRNNAARNAISKVNSSSFDISHLTVSTICSNFDKSLFSISFIIYIRIIESFYIIIKITPIGILVICILIRRCSFAIIIVESSNVSRCSLVRIIICIGSTIDMDIVTITIRDIFILVISEISITFIKCQLRVNGFYSILVIIVEVELFIFLVKIRLHRIIFRCNTGTNLTISSNRKFTTRSCNSFKLICSLTDISAKILFSIFYRHSNLFCSLGDLGLTSRHLIRNSELSHLSGLENGIGSFLIRECIHGKSKDTIVITSKFIITSIGFISLDSTSHSIRIMILFRDFIQNISTMRVKFIDISTAISSISISRISIDSFIRIDIYARFAFNISTIRILDIFHTSIEVDITSSICKRMRVKTFTVSCTELKSSCGLIISRRNTIPNVSRRSDANRNFVIYFLLNFEYLGLNSHLNLISLLINA